MKQKYIHWIYLLLAVAVMHFAACTGNDETENLLNGEPPAGNTDSRGATPIAAEVQLSETERLQTQLAGALGNDAAAVQELAVSGIFYAEDVEYLHTLKALEKLDMTNVTIQSNDEHPYYEFSYSYIDSNGNIQEGDVSGHLCQNEISPHMFKGMASLTELKMPITVNYIGWDAFAGSALTQIDIPASVTTLGNNVFSYCENLHTLVIPETVIQVGDGLLNNCHNLSSVYWYPEIDAPDLQWGNEDCVLYLRTKNGKHPSWGPNWGNVVIDNVAESMKLNYDGYSQKNFTLPQVSKAKKISVTMRFDGYWTYPGNSSAWQTLTLPFTPRRIYHQKKGELAPFGSDKTDTKPFWLRQLTPQGFTDVTTIEPNKPYIIAMPYNTSLYLDEYNISGDVVFEAADVDFESIPNPLPADEGPEFYLYPTYTYVEPGNGIYVLNSHQGLDGYNAGSVFTTTVERGASCFEAYVTPKQGSDTRTVYTIDTRTANTRSVSQPNTSGIPAIGDR